MSLPIPLTVRLKTDRADRDITSEIRNLAFRSNAVGGYAYIRAGLDRPLTNQPDEIAYYGQMFVYDARSGATVCEGRLEDPSRSAGRDGQVWSLTAVGPSAHARDRTIPLIYVDTSLRDLVRADNATPGAYDSVGQDPGTTTVQEALILQLPDGLGVVTDSRVAVRYDKLWRAGQKLARYDYTWDAGRTSASLLVEAVVRTDGVGGAVSRTQAFTTAGGGSSPTVIVTGFSSGSNTVEFRIRWTGAATAVADDVTWASIRNLVVQGTRYNAAGSELLAAADYTSNTLLASEIVADLLGRLLPKFDGVNASIATTSYAIDQLVYPDGVTAAQVLDDLLKLQPTYRWGAWESNSSGLHRFEFGAWPTMVKYETDVTDGYTSTGSADGLYNAVTVRWRDPQGVIRQTRRTSTVAELTSAGLTREAILDLGDNVGSSANATQAGDQFLAEHQYPPNAGRLTIARPVLDMERGHTVMPWEILPGNLIRVRGVQPRVDALNATTRDGVTVFKIQSVEYDAGSAAAVLELDSWARTSTRELTATWNAQQFARRR